ncbi:hypothetical protein AAG906_001446 [Vitis piasezkii]
MWSGGVTTHSKKHTSDYCEDRKKSLESLGFNARFETFKAKTKTLLTRAKRYKGRTSTEAISSLGTHEFSITKCMEALENIGLLDNDKYVKVVEKFTSVK